MLEIKNDLIRARRDNRSKLQNKRMIIMSIKLATVDFADFVMAFQHYFAFLLVDALNGCKPTRFWNFLQLVSIEFLIMQ